MTPKSQKRSLPHGSRKQTMIAISTSLFTKMRTLLLECEELSSSELLRTVFNEPRLHPFKINIPEATNRAERVDRLIDFLMNRKLKSGEILMIGFLETLKSRIPIDDARQLEIEEIMAAISGSEGTSQPSRKVSHKKNKPEDEASSNPVPASSDPITHKDIMTRLDQMETNLNDHLGEIKQDLSYLYQKIQPIEAGLVREISEEIHRGRLEQGEIRRMVDATRRTVKHILETGVHIDDPRLTSILKEFQKPSESAGGLSFDQQVEFSLPIIPLLLEYKISLGAGVDLKDVWNDLLKKIRNKTAK